MKRIVPLFAFVSLAACTGSNNEIDDVQPPIADAATVAPEPSAPAVRQTPITFAHVIHTTGAWVVLSTSAEEGWARGEPRFDRGSDHWLVERDVDARTLPHEITAREGTMLRLFDELGPHCTARIGTPVVAGYYESTAISRFLANEDGTEISEDDPAAPARGWTDSQDESRLVVAPLEALDGDCDEAVWADDPSLPLPTIDAVHEADASMRRDALRAFHATDVFAASRADLADRATADEMASLDDDVRVTEIDGAAGHYVWTVLDHGDHCGDNSAYASAVFRVVADGSLVRMPEDHDFPTTPPSSRIEFVGAAPGWMDSGGILRVGFEGDLETHAVYPITNDDGCDC